MFYTAIQHDLDNAPALSLTREALLGIVVVLCVVDVVDAAVP